MSSNRIKSIRRKLTGLFPAWFFIEFVFLRATMALINFFPITISTWIARRIGDIVFLMLPRRRRIALENITIAFGNTRSNPEKVRIALESFRNLVTCFVEFFRVPKFAKISEKHIRFQGLEHGDSALAKKKGVILAISHLGPWEYLGFIPYLKKYRSAILGRPIKNPYLYRWFMSIREMMAIDYIDKDMGPKAIFSKLKENYGIAVAIDQWAGDGGIWVNFFARPTSTTSIPAEFAKRTGCVLLPAYCIRIASGEYEICIGPEVVLKEDDNDCVENATKELNHRLEENIRAFPEQWMWTHKRWKEKKEV